MITFDQATQLGYTIVPGAGSGVIVKDGFVVAQIVSDQPRFFRLRHIAEIEGDDLASTQVTSGLIQQVSGEAYVDPPPPPPPVPSLQEKVAAALEQIQTGDGTAPVTADQLASVIQALTS